MNYKVFDVKKKVEEGLKKTSSSFSSDYQHKIDNNSSGCENENFNRVIEIHI